MKVLATSRAPLHLRGEREVPVAPLAVPDVRQGVSIERLSQYEAVRLFIARAQDAVPDFAVTNETAPAVAEICARLDGLPLAIELAAARVKLLPPPALLARLERRLPLLTGGARDAPARQQALRATIGWSYDLLEPSEQMLFRRLTVFAGGISLEAAEEVASLDGEVECSPVWRPSSTRASCGSRRRPGEPRFTMLETVREFGLEALTAASEETEIRTRHATWVVRWAEAAAQELHGPEQIAWLDRLELERDNLRVAFAWALEHGDMTAAFGLITGLTPFWLVRGTKREIRSWLERALERFATPRGAQHAEALFSPVLVLCQEGDLAAAERAFLQAVAEAQDLDVPRLESSGLPARAVRDDAWRSRTSGGVV